jgi:hypothetical protein
MLGRMSKIKLCQATVLAVTVCMAALFVSAFAAPPGCDAQTAATERSVEGVVSGSGDTPLPGAVVYLKDLKTLSIRSFISTSEGNYRFGQVANGTDYELWADYKGKKSSVKSLSSFDNRKQKIINLKVDTK